MNKLELKQSYVLEIERERRKRVIVETIYRIKEKYMEPVR
jgi:hypothetical protein